MLALVDTPLVPDAAGVERIGQQAVEVSATERQPARSGSIRGEALLGTHQSCGAKYPRFCADYKGV